MKLRLLRPEEEREMRKAKRKEHQEKRNIERNERNKQRDIQRAEDAEKAAIINKEKERLRIEKAKNNLIIEKENFKKKYSLNNLSNSDVQTLRTIKDELYNANAHKFGGIGGSSKDVLKQQANLQNVLINQNWMILNSLKNIESLLEKLSENE